MTMLDNVMLLQYNSLERGDYMPTKSVALRIDAELFEYLEARAKKEHRTLSNMIVSILLDEMERTEESR
jgi:hypothetical protein